MISKARSFLPRQKKLGIIIGSNDPTDEGLDMSKFCGTMLKLS